MNLSSLLALPDGLEVVSITTTKKLLTVHIAACAASSVCPLCARAATHVRSYYTHLVADVPCAGRQVQLVLHVRKFRCDLLPDRQAKTAQSWLQAHPEIELVSRDRGGDYAAAARQGAPQALQASDRFHLVKNLAEAVQKALAHCGTQLRKDRKAAEMMADPPPQEPLASLVTSDGQPYSAHQTERYERYQQVVTLRDQGVKIKEIAKRVGLGTRTIQRWATQDGYVETNYHHRHRSRFDAYEAYVKQRWDQGCHNIQQLWREIKAQGYPHSDQALRKHIEALYGREKADFPEASCLDHFSSKKAMWLFIRRSTDLDETEREKLANHPSGK